MLKSHRSLWVGPAHPTMLGAKEQSSGRPQGEQLNPAYRGPGAGAQITSPGFRGPCLKQWDPTAPKPREM